MNPRHMYNLSHFENPKIRICVDFQGDNNATIYDNYLVSSMVRMGSS